MVYHIHAFALFRRGRLQLEKEIFLTRTNRRNQFGKERAIGFFERGLETLEKITDLKTFVLSTNGGDVFFLKTWGLILFFQEKNSNYVKTAVRNYSIEIEPLVRKAKEMFTKGLKFINNDRDINEMCWNAIALLDQLGSTLYTLRNYDNVKTNGRGDICIYGPNYPIYRTFSKYSTDLLTWACKKYKELSQKAKSSDNKAHVLWGEASFHLLSATPFIDQYMEIAQSFEYSDDPDYVRQLQKSGEKQLNSGINMLLEAEKMYTDKSQKDLYYLLINIANVKLKLRDLLVEIDYLPGESKKVRTSRDKLNEELKVDAIVRLKKTSSLGLGDFSGILEEIDYDNKDDG